HVFERADDRTAGDHRRRDPDAPLGPRDRSGDPVRELQATLGRKPHADSIGISGRNLARAPDDPALPELLEVLRVASGQRRGIDDGDHVLLARPRVVGPVRRAGPDGGGVAYDVLVMHEVGPAGYAAGLDRQRLDLVDARLRRGWNDRGGRAPV